MNAVTTPNVVFGETQANTSGPISGDGLELVQQIVTLSDGTFLVAYRVGTSILFQQFDAFGTPISVEGSFATPGYLADGDFSIVALDNGDVVLGYEAEGIGVTVVQSFSISAGVATETPDIDQIFATATDPVNGNGTPIEVSLSGSSPSTLVLHRLTIEPDGTKNLTMFTGLDGANPQQTDIATPFEAARSSIDSAVLTNGDIASVVVSFGADGDTRRELDIFVQSPDGTLVASPTASVTESTDISQAVVTALSGGGFVVAYGGGDGFDIDLFAKVFNADGTARSDTIVVLSNNPDFNNDPAIVALEDGGFLVLWDRDNNPSRVLGQRFDEDGDKVGSFFEVDRGGSIGFPDATLLEGGLVAISYVDSSAVNVKIVGTEALDIVLTDADETITGTEADDIIDAGAGDDTIDGGDGDDLIIGGPGADAIDGGEGIDTVSYADSSSGIAFRGTGTAGDAQGDTLANIEVIIGSEFNDQISYGSAFSGPLTFEGGAGNDLFDTESFFGQFADAVTFLGGEGNDTARISARLQENAAFNAGVFDGGAGVDSFDVTRGGPTLDLREVTIEDFEQLKFRGNADNYDVIVTAEQISQFEFVETKRNGSLEIDVFMEDETALDLSAVSTNGDNASAEDFFIFGDADAETITGSERSDVISGGGGDDILSGFSGRDTLTGGEGADTFRFLAAQDDDVITDFTIGVDQIDLSAFMRDFDFAQLVVPGVEKGGADLFLGHTQNIGHAGSSRMRIEAEQDGTSTLLTITNSDPVVGTALADVQLSIELENVNALSLSLDEFVF